jgi:hypothetical protein
MGQLMASIFESIQRQRSITSLCSFGPNYSLTARLSLSFVEPSTVASSTSSLLQIGEVDSALTPKVLEP